MYNNYTLKAYKLKARTDECYTLKEDAEYLMKKLTSQLNLSDQRKLIWLPFDSDSSEFTKYCKKHKLNYINTSDDYRNHSDILEKCDIIISNPPFSKLIDIYNDFANAKKDFVLIVPLHAVSYKCFFKALQNKEIRFYNCKINKFVTDKNKVKYVNTLVLSNLTYLNLDKDIKHIDKHDQQHSTVSSKYKVFNNTTSFFNSDLKIAYVPISICSFNYFNKVKFLDISDHLLKDKENNKYYFKRFLVEKEDNIL